MREIKCPNCGQVFQVDETGYAQIVQQIRDKEFEKELERREEELEEKKEGDLKMLRMEQEQKLKDTVSELKEEISRLNAQIEKNDTEKELAVTKAVQVKDKELSDAAAEVSRLQGELELQAKENKLNEILEGRVYQEDASYMYETRGDKIPISAAASSIRELAPLTLYLSNVNISTAAILMEEPEAHLHPLKQRMMGDVLSMMVASKAIVQITTHSDYLLKRLNELIALYNLKKKSK